MRVTTGISWLCGIGAAIAGASFLASLETIMSSFPAQPPVAVLKAGATAELLAIVLAVACLFFAIWSVSAQFLEKPSSTATVYNGPVAGPHAVVATGWGTVSQRNSISDSFNAPVSKEQYDAIRAVAMEILIRSQNRETRSRATELLDRADELRAKPNTDTGRMLPIVTDLLQIIEKTGPLAGAVVQAVGLLRTSFNL